jgi:hypothetical protein
MLWRDMRRRTKEEIHKELQDLDLIGFPHLEEIMIGGKVDLDLLSLFPQKDARNMGGIGRKGKLFKVNNGGERNGRDNFQMRKKGLYIAPARNLTITGILTQKFRPGGGISAPLIKFSPKISAPLQRVAPKRLSRISQGQKLRSRGRNFRP